jgi:hypothetical protein
MLYQQGAGARSGGRSTLEAAIVLKSLAGASSYEFELHKFSIANGNTRTPGEYQ